MDRGVARWKKSFESVDPGPRITKGKKGTLSEKAPAPDRFPEEGRKDEGNTSKEQMEKLACDWGGAYRTPVQFTLDGQPGFYPSGEATRASGASDLGF